MKFGISTWSLLQLDVDVAIKAIGDAGFDYIELWGEVPHAYHDWVDRGRLGDALSSYDMTVTLHAPFTDLNLASPFQPVRGAVAETLEKFVEFGAEIGAVMITVHPGNVHNQALVPKSAENASQTINRMVRAGRGRLAISVENQAKSFDMYHYPLASTPDSLQRIVDAVEDTRITLDTGHAHVSGTDPLAFAELGGERLAEIHLSDNSGSSDDHLIPGEGTVKLQKLFERIEGSEMFVCLELNPHKYSQDQVVAAASRLKSHFSGGSRGIEG